MKEKKIKLIQGQLDKLTQIQKNRFGYCSNSVQGWISGTISILERIFGKESLKIQEVRRIEESEQLDLDGENYYEIADLNQFANSILQTCIDEIESLGTPSTLYDGKNNNINLTMIQNQSNNQTVDIKVILEALNDGLTGTQLKEIQSIIDSKEDKENKKHKILDKLKEFGIDTVSNIVSSILTNLISGNK